jgi:methylase of polypeptide subunit release factors
MIIVECGFDQGQKVKEIFSERDMETVILKDLAGIERIVAARRQ